MPHRKKIKLGFRNIRGFPGDTMVNNPPANAGDAGDGGLISGSGWSPGEGNGNPFQYSCLGNPMDRRAWQATVHGVTKMWLSTRIPPQEYKGTKNYYAFTVCQVPH